MEIKEKIEELVRKFQGDDELKTRFKKNPVKAVEDLLGVDLPDEAVQKIVAGVKAKLNLDSFGGIFGKK